MIVRPLPALGLYELVEPLPYQGGVVPAGFQFDGASFPRLTWTIIGYTPFHPKVMRGAGGHDYDYRVRTGVRRVADEWFRETIIEDGVPEADADRMFAAVRQFGVLTWADAEDERERARRAEQERERAEQAP